MNQFELELSDKKYHVGISPDQQTANINGRVIPFQIVSNHDERLLIRLGTKVYQVTNSSMNGTTVSFLIDGNPVEVSVKDEQQILLEKLGFTSQNAVQEGVINAPMPGKILEILVKEGDQVASGSPLVVLEAMKMENELKSPVAGVVKSIGVTTGDSVEKNQKLLEIEIVG